MKNLIAFFIGSFFVLTLANAQVIMEPISKADYRAYIDNKLKVDYRNESIKALDLTYEQIIKFDPVFFAYMSKKEGLLEKRIKLVENFREERAENNSQKDQTAERADFIENYWEVAIAERELRKNYFGKLEEEIPVRKAAQFFLWEGAIENRIFNNAVAAFVPQFRAVDHLPEDWQTITTPSEVTPNNVTEEEYRYFADKRLEMEFRNTTLEILNFSKEEILAFDPIFKEYMSKKDELLAKRDVLLGNFRDEIAEDDSQKDEDAKRADFIENYWENEIAGMELSKDYFDILEDKIPLDKAIKFFVFEKAVENRIAMNAIAQMMPHYIVIEQLPQVSTTAETNMVQNGLPVTIKEIEANEAATIKAPESNKVKLSDHSTNGIQSFDKWVQANRGQVSLSHQYTSSGLIALINTVEAVKNDKNVNIPDFATKKAMILERANQMTLDWKSTMHADYAKEAFTAITEIMAYLKTDTSKATQLKNITIELNKDRLMTKQAGTIYRFFDAANTQLLEILQQDTELNSSKIVKNSSGQ